MYTLENWILESLQTKSVGHLCALMFQVWCKSSQKKPVQRSVDMMREPSDKECWPLVWPYVPSKTHRSSSEKRQYDNKRIRHKDMIIWTRFLSYFQSERTVLFNQNKDLHSWLCIPFNQKELYYSSSSILALHSIQSKQGLVHLHKNIKRKWSQRSVPEDPTNNTNNKSSFNAWRIVVPYEPSWAQPSFFQRLSRL